MNLIVVFLSIEKSVIGKMNAWEKLKYANPVDVLTVIGLMSRLKRFPYEPETETLPGFGCLRVVGPSALSD
jgi:hypothetical protein